MFTRYKQYKEMKLESQSKSKEEKQNSEDSHDLRSEKAEKSSDSESNSDDGESQAKVHDKPDRISTLEELNKLRISRYKLEKLIHVPIFEKTVVGCFVRINIGINERCKSRKGPKLNYRVAEITAVVDSQKIYDFGKEKTNKSLRLKHGTQERVFRMEFVGNQNFTQSELDKWKSICLHYNIEMPRLDLIEQKERDIRAALDYEYKEEDVDRIVKEKNRFRDHPTNYAARKIQLMKERDAAILHGHQSKVNDINSELQGLEDRASELDQRRTRSIEMISYINRRNRKKNFEESEKANIEDAKAEAEAIKQYSIEPAPASPQPIAKKMKVDSLYEINDFEIDWELSFASTRNDVGAAKPVKEVKDSSLEAKRRLTLESYKKKRGLV